MFESTTAPTKGWPSRILITGAGGLIGNALSNHFAGRTQTITLGHDELDITNDRQVQGMVSSHRPGMIINCAVAGVDECESDPELARRINVDGPALLAAAASRSGASIIHFSSNYVFGGERNDLSFYEEKDLPVPINVYGKTKLEGEQLVAATCSRSWIVRTSWVFGKGKQSFLATAPARLKSGERLLAIDDIFASATYVRDLAKRIEAIIQKGSYGLYHVNNSGVCSHAEYAKEAARILGLSMTETQLLIERKGTSSVSRVAARPRWTPMRCGNSERLGLPPMRLWQEALAAYISETATD